MVRAGTVHLLVVSEDHRGEGPGATERALLVLVQQAADQAEGEEADLGRAADTPLARS